MKKFFTWRDDWSLGVELIDRQHHQLAVLLNSMAELYLNSKGETDAEQRAGLLKEQLKMLCEKTREHFNDEEGLMLEAGYPDHPEHAREHRMLIAELRYYLRDIEEERENINKSVLISLKTWYISHIIKSDKEFVDFLQAQSQNKTIPAQAISMQRQVAGVVGKTVSRS